MYFVREKPTEEQKKGMQQYKQEVERLNLQGYTVFHYWEGDKSQSKISAGHIALTLPNGVHYSFMPSGITFFKYFDCHSKPVTLEEDFIGEDYKTPKQLLIPKKLFDQDKVEIKECKNIYRLECFNHDSEFITLKKDIKSEDDKIPKQLLPKKWCDQDILKDKEQYDNDYRLVQSNCATTAFQILNDANFFEKVLNAEWKVNKCNCNNKGIRCKYCSDRNFFIFSKTKIEDDYKVKRKSEMTPKDIYKYVEFCLKFIGWSEAKGAAASTYNFESSRTVEEILNKYLSEAKYINCCVVFICCFIVLFFLSIGLLLIMCILS